MALITIITFLLFQFNTSLFIFKNTYNISSDDIKEISYFLESEHNRITEKWNLNRKGKTTIIFCGSTDDFVQRTGASRKIGAMYKNDAIFLQPVNLLKHKRILKNVLKHELLHAVLDKQVNIPKWFNEAFAIYESGELSRVKKKTVIKFKSITELERHINSKDYKSIETAYYFLGLSMQYLVQKYGTDKIKLLLEKNRNNNFFKSFHDAFGEPFESVDKNILQYLDKF